MTVLPKQGSGRSDLCKQRAMQEGGPGQGDAAGVGGPSKRRHSPGHADANLEGKESSKRHRDDPGVIGDTEEAGLIQCMDCRSMKDLNSFARKVQASISCHRGNPGSPRRRTRWVCKCCTQARCGSLVKLCSGCNSECIVDVTCSSSQASRPAKTRLCFTCNGTSAQERKQEVTP